MGKAGRTRWYLEPLDTSTNENAAGDLARVCGIADENIHCKKRDSKGKKHDVIEVDYAFIARMERGVLNFKHRFRVYTQREGASTMRLLKYVYNKKSHHTKKSVKSVAKKLRELAKQNEKTK